MFLAGHDGVNDDSRIYGLNSEGKYKAKQYSQVNRNNTAGDNAATEPVSKYFSQLIL